MHPRFLLTNLVIYAGLSLATLAVYLPFAASGFVNFDDPDSVIDNPRVARAFTSTGHANWFPLTLRIRRKLLQSGREDAIKAFEAALYFGPLAEAVA